MEMTKILVVEDETDLEFLLTRKFRKRIRAGELHFLFAHNGLEALEKLEAQPDVYVVLSDIKMPQMDGLTLLSELNERYPLIRTIMVTAYGDMSNIRTAMNRGAYDFLTKPINFTDLEATLNKTIRYVEQLVHNAEERKRAENQLIQLQKAVKNMRLGVTIADLNGNILYTNPAEASMHGYEMGELIGRPVGILAPPEYRHPMTPEQLQEWDGSVRESINIRKDGTIFPVWLISDTVKDADGKLIAIVTSCEDITERKQAEEELKKHRDHLEESVNERTLELSAANEKLAELNASKDKFFSIISHDLRSPFSVMLGYSQLIEANFETYGQDKIKRLFRKLRVAAERLYVLLENLLTWARIQQGVMENSPRALSIAKLAEEVRELMLSQASQKHIELRNATPTELFAYADYNMIGAVIRNLLSNALKFTPEGGSVTISAQRKDPMIEVMIADNGIGIKEENVPKLFRVDAQYTNTGTAGEKGTGLGLNLCKDLVEQNGGTIRIESEFEKGTQVTFTLPMPSAEKKY